MAAYCNRMAIYAGIWLWMLLLLAACEREIHTVRYEISGTATKIAVSYINDTGATEQRDVAAWWSKQFQAKTWTYVGVTAFNSTFKGTVTCRLYVDGVLIKKAESIGGLKLASCDTLAGVKDQQATPTTRR